MTYEVDKRPSWWPLPWFKNRIILITAGTVNAGIDLDKLNEQDIVVDGEKVVITLPPPEVFGDPTLDLDETYVLEGSTINPFRPDWNEAIEAQRKAKDAMLDWALEHGLLDTAKESAERQIELLVLRLGFSTVEVRWQDR